MTIIPADHEDGKTIDGRFEIFFKRFKVNSILRKINATKEKGVLASVLVCYNINGHIPVRRGNH